ncbi:MAG: hypothetical protein ACW98X_17540 [Promethearchaeota archaeon]|jgi:hypothetical protein
MGAGKILVLIGGLLTLVSTFFLSFYVTGGGDYGSGLGFIFNIADIMANPGTYVPGETMTVYIVAIVYIVFLISGILQLAGLASRVVAIIGSIFVLAISILMLLVLLNVLAAYAPYLTLFDHAAIVPGILPLDVPLGSASLGAYLLLGGGVLGFVGGILGTKD